MGTGLDAATDATGAQRGGKREKPPEVKVRWSWPHYLALAVGGFALVCVVWAVLAALLG